MTGSVGWVAKTTSTKACAPPSLVIRPVEGEKITPAIMMSKLSDCKYAGDDTEEGLVWCNKKNIYVSAKEKENCPDYEKLKRCKK